MWFGESYLQFWGLKKGSKCKVLSPDSTVEQLRRVLFCFGLFFFSQMSYLFPDSHLIGLGGAQHAMFY